MIKVRNLETGAVVVINDVKRVETLVKSEKGIKGQRFITKWAHILEVHDADLETQYFTLKSEWEFAGRSPRTEKREAVPAAEPVAVPAEPTVMDEVVEPADVVEAPAEPQPEPKVKAAKSDDEDAALLIAALKRLKGGSVDEATVRQIVTESLNEMLASMDEPKKKVLVAKAKSSKKEVYCEKFERIVAKVSRGNHVYLHGPAGCGKSHTAEQIAERLGLDYYSQTTIQFAHDVRGYGDAGGNFCETPFFKAFSQGGLYFQDEYDRSNSEAAIVLNTALANGYYDFPIVGRVVAHPDFRFIAAGNTLMKGADEEYVSGQPQDASCRDRFGFFFKVDYSHEVELAIAHNNTEIVDFVEDVRRAVAACGLQHVVSYRATAAMTDEVEHENDKVACAEECIFKGLEKDEIREIYGALSNKENAWARATKKLF